MSFLFPDLCLSSSDGCKSFESEKTETSVIKQASDGSIVIYYFFLPSFLFRNIPAQISRAHSLVGMGREA